MILEAAPGAHTEIPAWSSRDDWVAALSDFAASARGRQLASKHRIALGTLLHVAMADARAASSGTGRDVATSNATVARQVHRSTRTVQRARAFLEEAGFSRTLVEGRYLTTAERRRAGGRQIRAASTRALTSPQDRPPTGPRNMRPRPNGVLPRRGRRPRVSPVSERSPRTGVDNSGPVQIGFQRLAAGLTARMPALTAHCHIGRLSRALARAAIPPTMTTTGLLDAIEAGNREAGRTVLDVGEQRDPLGYFLHLIAQTPLRHLAALPPRGDPMQHPDPRPRNPLECTPARTAAGRSHHYDPVSGWCRYGCGVRNDGRVLGPDGRVIKPGPDPDAPTLWSDR